MNCHSAASRPSFVALQYILRRPVLAALAAMLAPSLLAASLSGAGSTFAEPLYQRWGELYRQQGGAEVAYAGVGSGEGVKRIAAKQVDFGGSDEPLKRAELDEKGLRQFPVAMGAIVPAVNLPGVPDGALKLNADVLAGIYTGRIKRWTDAAILNLNDEIAPKIPDLPVKPVFRSDASGSTFVFSYYLSARSADWKKGPGVGKQLAGLAGSGGQGSGGVVERVRAVPGSIGYVEFGRALKDKLNVAQLPNRVGTFVKASAASIQAAAQFEAEKLLYAGDPDFYLVLADSDTYAGWPMATATFALLPRGKEALKTLDFLLWGYRNGDAALRELGYVALPESMKIGVRKAWSRQYGFKAGA